MTAGIAEYMRDFESQFSGSNVTASKARSVMRSSELSLVVSVVLCSSTGPPRVIHYLPVYTLKNKV